LGGGKAYAPNSEKSYQNIPLPAGWGMGGDWVDVKKKKKTSRVKTGGAV